MAVRRIEQAAFQVQCDPRVERLACEDDGDGPQGVAVVRDSMTTVGEQPSRALQANNGVPSGPGFSGAHLGEVPRSWST